MKAWNKEMGIYLRCDNSSENKMLATEAKAKGMNVIFEFTAPGTPEENGKVERTFATLWGRVRAALNLTNFNEYLRTGLWTECANCVTQQSNICVKAGRELSPYEEFYGRKAIYEKSLRVFGEMGIRTVRKGHQDKLDDRGDICIFVGYPEIHYHDTYRLFKMQTKTIVESRDVRWIGKIYKEPRIEIGALMHEELALSVATQSDPM